MDILREGYRKELFLSTTPLDTNKSCLMNQERGPNKIEDFITVNYNKKKQKEENKLWLLIYKLMKKLFIRSCARALNVSQTPIKHGAIINSMYKIVVL